jgi:hypothetical protein
MRNKGLVTLCTAAVLAVGYAVYDFQSEKSTEKKKAEQSRLVAFDKDQISSFEVQPAGIPAIHVDRTPEGWKLTKPVQEVADQSAADDYVGGTVLEQSKDLVKSGADIDWKIYGLDQPKAVLIFTVNSGSEIKVDVSEKKNFAGDSYARVEGVDKVYTVANTWFLRANKRSFDFRDKRLLKKSAATIQSFRSIRGDRVVAVEKKDNVWISPLHPDWKLDQVKTNEAVYMLNTVNALEFSKEGAPTNSELKSFGLNQPRFVIEAVLKEDKKWKASFVEHDKKRFVLISDPPQVLQISAQDMDKMGNLTLENLRDRHEPFNFDKALAKKLHIKNGDLSVDFELKGEDWTLLNEDKSLEYQAERPKSVLALVRNLEAMDYEPPAQKDIKPNVHEAVTFYGADGKPVIEIVFSGSYKKKVDGIDKNFVLAKSSLFATPVGVDEGTLRAIGLESIVKKKGEALPEAKPAAVPPGVQQ